MKMANQFRGLDSEEVNFLEAHQREKHAEEAARKRADDDVLEAFRQCVRAPRLADADCRLPDVRCKTAADCLPLSYSQSAEPRALTPASSHC